MQKPDDFTEAAASLKEHEAGVWESGEVFSVHQLEGVRLVNRIIILVVVVGGWWLVVGGWLVGWLGGRAGGRAAVAGVVVIRDQNGTAVSNTLP